MRRHISPFVLIHLAAWALVVAAAAAAAATVTPTRAGEQSALIDRLRLKNQPFAALTWRASVTDARRLAAEQRKPIFLVVNTGNCLGFV